MAIGDIDNDGKIDAVVTTNDGPLYLLHNETPTQNHWLLLDLVGHRSNRDAIGAEVTVNTSRGKQLATVTTAGSYLSSSDKRVHFGLGGDTVANIEIRWPAGIVQTLTDVRADQILQSTSPYLPRFSTNRNEAQVFRCPSRHGMCRGSKSSQRRVVTFSDNTVLELTQHRRRGKRVSRSIRP
jgi:hypothetical protein